MALEVIVVGAVVVILSVVNLMVALKHKHEVVVVRVTEKEEPTVEFQQKRLRYWDRLSKICESAGR